MIVVSDTSPLISLMKASKLDVLRNLYGEILIPEAVYEELTTNPHYDDEADQIKVCPFIRKVSVKERKAVTILQKVSGLDMGESEAIIYTEENKADILLMDEDAGRRVAKSLGIRVRGTVGILLLAYDKKLISAEDVKATMEKLRNENRRISNQLIQYAYDYVSEH